MLRHIAWFNETDVQPSPEGNLTSSDACTCCRCLAPARELEKLGVDCSVFGNLSDADPAHVAKHLQKLNSDIVVIGKISGPSLVKLAKTAKHLGCYVVADLGHASNLSPDALKLADFADQLIAATPAAAASILEKTGNSAIVIADCDEHSTGATAPDVIAQTWMDAFKKLKMKPPQCANSNVPAGA
ncbi:MAG TPA: hypothetical protein VFR09_06440 [Alphaproteobacteria bacterium]|nr:hypothetical protein [Alphaproteobacteria bacterium]